MAPRFLMGTINQRRGLARARRREAPRDRLARHAAEGEYTGRDLVLALAAEPRSVREPTSGAGQRLALGRRGASSDRSPVDVHTHRVRAGGRVGTPGLYRGRRCRQASMARPVPLSTAVRPTHGGTDSRLAVPCPYTLHAISCEIECMSDVRQLLPKLALNRDFIDEFMTQPEACCALGVIEERRRVLPLIAIRPHCPLPLAVTEQGFTFGHSVLGTSAYEVVHFAFTFRNVGNFNVLLNPSDPIVRDVLARMVKLGAFFVLAIDPRNAVTAFLADVGEVNLTGLIDHQPRLANSATTEAQYNYALAQFRIRPEPSGVVLDWVCRGDLGHLDLSKPRLELTPAS